jgi:hypothetical protein
MSACACRIEIEQNGSLRGETLDANRKQVKARELRQQMMQFFHVGNPTLEVEPESDEDESWVLLGFTGDGKSVEIEGDNVVELDAYRTFRLTPRTAAGGV